MIHIGVSWDWNPGQRIDIPVMTNCREAELLLNGVSLGRKRPAFSDPKKCLPVWTIPYVPGVLTARGYGTETFSAKTACIPPAIPIISPCGARMNSCFQTDRILLLCLLRRWTGTDIRWKTRGIM